MKNQKDVIEERNWEVILWLDAGRFDFMNCMYDRYVDGELEPVYNGGHGFTGTWTPEHFGGEYEAQFYHGGQPIHSFLNSDYDEREHFREVINHHEYEWNEDIGTCTPPEVRRIFEENYDGGKAVVRFLAPHPPFRKLVEYTRGKNRASRTRKGVMSGDISKEDVKMAYEDMYHWVMCEVVNIVEMFPDKNIVVTSDHGEMLGEDGLFFHAKGFPDRDEMTKVPWLEVGQ